MQPNPAPAAIQQTKPPDPNLALQFVLWFEMMVRCTIWLMALAATVWVGTNWEWFRLTALADHSTFGGAMRFAWRIMGLIFVFNIAYLLELAFLRMLIPAPTPGRYSLKSARPNRNLLYSCGLAIITKSRYQPPFPAILVAHLANIIPLRWLMGATVGPRTQSPFFVEPNIIDPWGITIGKNVVLGFGSTVAAHMQEQDSVRFDRVIIEDNALVGAFTSLGPGVHVKRGAMIRPYSMVLPDTIIGEGEYWGGIPARRMRDAPPAQPQSTTATVSGA